MKNKDINLNNIINDIKNKNKEVSLIKNDSLIIKGKTVKAATTIICDNEVAFLDTFLLYPSGVTDFDLHEIKFTDEKELRKKINQYIEKIIKLR